ncbi:MAG TPA: Ig-like domain-containing protein, partial [Chitinophagaceae bacterium]|nr:Ig-like domain-containing protein [Chitinophagaceae bacterium]
IPAQKKQSVQAPVSGADGQLTVNTSPQAQTQAPTTVPSSGPVGTPDAYAVPSDKTLSIAAPGFLANDIDLKGEVLTAVAIVTNVAHGTLAAFGNGSFTYTPTAGYTGPDAFQYRMRDASGILSDPVDVTITVLAPANRTPIGSPDVYAALSGTALSIAAPGFLANDIDPDGETITAIAIVTNVTHGSLAAFGNGSFTYTPTAGFTGTDAFQYRMRDASNHLSDPVNVTINVVEGNRPPIGIDDQYTAVINTALSIAAPGFLANDVDPDGDVITAIAIVSNVTHGSLAAFGNGSFTYTPTAGYTGPDAFQYRMRDAVGHTSDPVNVTINVISPNRPPVADAGSDQNVDCDGSGGATVTLDGSGSSDPDNDALTYTWRENGSIIAGPTTEAQVKVFLSLGIHNIELTVDDGAGHTATDN